MKKLISLIVLLPTLALGQGLSFGVPWSGSSGQTLASFPFTSSGGLIAEDANTVSHVIFNSAVTNYALYSNTMTGNWPILIATEVAGAASTLGGTWNTVTSTGSTGFSYRALAAAFPATSTITNSVWMQKESGTGYASVWAACASDATVAQVGCACTRSDGAACTTRVPLGNYCATELSDLGTTAVRVSVTISCASAVTGAQIVLSPGRYGTAVGTTSFVGGQIEVGVTRPSDLVVTTTAPVTVRPVNTNYALQSNSMSTGSAFTSPWAGTSATVTTPGAAPAAQGGGTWAEITTTVTGGYAAILSAATASSATKVASVWMAKTSGTGTAGVIIDSAGGTVTSCTCARNDGGACTPVVSTTQCRVHVYDLGTTPVRLESRVTYAAPNAASHIIVIPGEIGVSTGTTRFTGAQLEVGTAASGLIPTLGTAVVMDRSLIDLKGNLWAMAGTVPQVQGTPSPFTTVKPGAGPFSDGNYYSLASPNPLQFTGDFTACFIYSCASKQTDAYMFSSINIAGNLGWMQEACRTSGGDLFYIGNGAGFGAAAPGDSVSGGANIVCSGRSGGTNYSKVNLGTSGSLVRALSPSTGDASFLGKYAGGGYPLSNGTIYEAWFTTSPWNEANVLAIQQRVLGHYDGSSPLAVTRATNATYLDATGTLYTAAAGVARITADGLLVEPARTNYALQSNTISTATAFTAPWTAVTSTVSTVAGAPLSGTWAEVVSTAVTGSAYQNVTTASTTTTVASAWLAKASGTGYAGIISDVGAGTTHTTCTCLRSDGGTCTATITPATLSSQYCLAEVADLGTTPIRLSVISTANAAGTAKNLSLVPGRWATATGTTRFTGAQLEVGTYPTSLIVTAGTAVARNADAISATVPAVGAKWCVAGAFKPEEGRSWSPGGYQMLWATGTGGAANSASTFAQPTNSGMDNEVWDGGAAFRLARTSALAFSAGTSHRIVSCDPGGPALTLSFDSILQAPTLSGAGTGLFSAAPTTLRLGSRSDGYEFGGYLKNLKLCNAKSPKECR